MLHHQETFTTVPKMAVCVSLESWTPTKNQNLPGSCHIRCTRVNVFTFHHWPQDPKQNQTDPLLIKYSQY